MPTRSRSHEINAAGDAILRRVIPTRWAIRAQHENDYGIDYEIEIFGPDRKSTAALFKIQLKSSASCPDSDEVSLQVSLEDLDYWKGLPVPVLLVFVDVERDRIWCEWTSDLDPHPRELDQAKKTFHFTDRHRLHAGRFDALERRVQAWRSWRERSVSFPVAVSVLDERHADDAPTVGVLRDRLREALSKVSTLELRTSVSGPTGLSILLRPEETRFTTPAGPDLVLDATLSQWWSGEGASEVLACLGLALSISGWRTEGAELIEGPSRNALWLQPPLAAALAGALVAGGRVDLAIEAVGQLIDGGPDLDACVASALLAVTFEPVRVAPPTEAVRALLVRRYHQLVATEGDGPRAAQAAYNTGNYVRCHGQHDEALKWFDQAATADPSYEERGYFQRERGNCLFELGEFQAAHDAFQRATDLGDDFPWLPVLHGDALIGCGRYRDASTSYAAGVGLDEPLGAEARVAARATAHAADRVGDVQHRAVDEVSHPIDWSADAEAIEALLKADATNASAWLRSAFQTNEHLEDLLAAAVFSRFDGVLLAGAAFAALEHGELHLAKDLAILGRRYDADGFLPRLQQLLSESNRNDLVELAADFFDEAPGNPALPTTVRLHQRPDTGGGVRTVRKSRSGGSIEPKPRKKKGKRRR